MRTNMLFRTLVIAIIAGSLSFVELADAQDQEQKSRRASNHQQTQDTFVLEVDESGLDTDVELTQRTGGNVFVIQRPGNDITSKTNNQVIRWLVKPGSNAEWVHEHDEPHSEPEGHSGNQRVIVLRGQGSQTEEGVIRIQGDQMKGRWVPADGDDYQLLLIHENGNVERIKNRNRTSAHDGDLHEHAHQEHAHQEHAHQEHAHQEHDGRHHSIHPRHDEMHFDGGDEVHQLIIEALAKHGISLDDDHVDVDVERTDDGKMSIRIKAEKEGGSASSRKRIEMNVERARERIERHPPHDRQRVTEIEVRPDRDSGRRVARFGPGSGGPSAARGAVRNDQRHMHNGPDDLNQRLGRLEQQLESLERKIDRLLRSSDGNRGRTGPRESQNRRGNERQNDPRSRDSKGDDGQSR